MTELFRGGNSRLLARQLDQLQWPVVVLDQRLEIVFASGSLCQTLAVEAGDLVGLACRASLSEDQSPQPELAMILAPPSEVLHGKAALRQVPWPPKQSTMQATQAFIPLIDDDPSSGLILILFGQPELLWPRLAPLAPPSPPRGHAADEVLQKLRSQWPNLDGLWPLLGSSPEITQAMRRAQLACQCSASVWLTGPPGSGKSETARAMANIRIRAIDQTAMAPQIVPIDCGLASQQTLISALDTIQARMRPGASPLATHLILEGIQRASGSVAAAIRNWLQTHGSQVSTIVTSDASAAELGSRWASLSELVAQLSTIEIHLPPLAERREDVPPQVHHHLTAAAARAGRRLPAVAPATMELLQAYPWPGNAVEVRQAASDMLNNAVLTATIHPNHLPLAVRTFAGTLSNQRAAVVEPISLDDVLLDLERIMLQRAIKLSPRNRARAARMLGISRPRFLRRIAQLGLDDKKLPSSEEE